MPATREDHIAYTKNELNNYEYYVKILNYLKDKQIKNYLDIGANIGEFCNVLFEKIPSLKNAYLVEVEENNFNFMLKHVKNKNVTCINCGITYGVKNPTIIPSPDNNVGGFRVVEGNESSKNTISKTLEDLNLPIIDFIKMDIEGGEYPIIENSKYLQEIKYIDLEFHNHGYIPPEFNNNGNITAENIKIYVKKYFPNHQIIEIDKEQVRCFLKKNNIEKNGIKKYDIISLNNELDMLEIRLNVLNDYVDYFVIVEATETFSGVPKPLNYLINRDRYKKFHEKIIYYVVNDTPKDVNDGNCNQKHLNEAKVSPNVTWEHPCWLKEFYQKEAILDALKNLSDDDICYISDLDEIWNYDLKFDIEDNKIYRYNIDYCYIEYLNLRTNENWTYFTGPLVTKWGTIKNDVLNHVRSPRGETKNDPRYVYLSNGGWHFNALGGIVKKVQDFKHPQYPIWEMEGRKHRTGNFIEEKNLPKLLIEKKDKLKNYFLNP